MSRGARGRRSATGPTRRRSDRRRRIGPAALGRAPPRGRQGGRRRRRAAPPRPDRAARRRPRPRRGRAGHRQDAPRARGRARARPPDGPRPGHARPPAERRHRLEHLRGAAAFGSSPGPVFTNILLVDEINRATPRTQSALLEAMQERQVSIEGTTHPCRIRSSSSRRRTRSSSRGRSPCPRPSSTGSSSASRSAIRTKPTSGGSPGATRPRPSRSTRSHPVADAAPAARRCATRSATSHVSDEVEAYVVALVRATREHEDLQLGREPAVDGRAVPRGPGIGAARRPRVRPARRRQGVASAVLAHRLVVDLDRSLRGATAESAMAAILDRVPAPPIGPAAGLTMSGLSLRGGLPGARRGVRSASRSSWSWGWSCSCSRRSGRSGPATACAA